MSQPEISIRCSSCGAAVREPAMFCPECGKPMATPPAIQPESSAEGSEAAPPATIPEPIAIEEKQPAAAANANTVATEAAAIASQSARPDESDSPSVRERTRERLHRASNAARGAVEGNVKRVEKIHHVSAAMLEEAHYDPSLRFVLVALGLFVVAIILLVLSKVMG
jgi:hypothetical protein